MKPIAQRTGEPVELDMTLDSSIGSVAVVGGGIGGMQTALDLAESGYKVYLVEKESSIGGRMAQLDKTFPTNDCAMCMISPKLVECGRHRNIEIITNADVESLVGEPGDMKLRLTQRARYVDDELCNACGLCEQACPIRLPDEFNGELQQRSAIYRRYPQAIPGTYVIDKQGVSPCRIACPAGVNGHGYVALTAQGRIEDAYKLIRSRHPLPSVCGRVCHHPCEQSCHRGAYDAPVGINDIKRYVGDTMLTRASSNGVKLSDYSSLDLRGDPELDPSPVIEAREGKVAIVGSGPAGLTAAYDLAQLGYGVTIFEAAPVAGGMLTLGIPEYRLPRDILQAEIQVILDLGIELKTGCRVGTDISMQQIRDDFDSVLLAVGMSHSRPLDVPGEDLNGVLQGIEFLRDMNLGNAPTIGKHVAIIGGGNTAIDAARSVLRMGAEEVTIVYRRTEAEMPAIAEEIEHAHEEEIKFYTLATPVEFLGDGNSQLTAMRCIRMELGEPDESGRRRPVPVEGSEFDLPVDTVIVAIGQTPDLSFVEGICEIERDSLVLDPATLATGVDGIFASGDVVTGPRSVVEAVAQGHQAALSIDRHLRQVDMAVGREIPERQEADIPARQPNKTERQIAPFVSPTARRQDFREIFQTLSDEQALAEASRCLSCADCAECMQCVEACDPKAIMHQDVDKRIELDVGGVVLAVGYDLFDATQLGEYGFGRYPNVVTNLQFERMLSASGPYAGHIPIESVEGRPKKIAFIQCVGSRDLRNNPYCSGVCCMVTAKEAIVAKEHDHEIESTVFYMELRAFSKGFDRLIHRAKNEHGVRYVRSMVSEVIQLPDTGTLLLRYRDEDGNVEEEEFDLVVLATGMRPSEAGQELAKRIDVELDQYGFARTLAEQAVQTTRPGVFVTGAFSGPKDIPETVMEASGVAAAIQKSLAQARHTQTIPGDYPAERDVLGEEPRIGVFVCHCGSNIAGVVDSAGVAEFAANLPNVVHSENVLYACSQDNLERLKQAVEEKNLNRLLVASCTPRTHEPLFHETCKEAGLNPFLFEMADIREQVSWVHMDIPDAATQKAKHLVEMAVNKAALLKPLGKQKIVMRPSTLVVGGGMSAVAAALAIVDGGFEAHVVTTQKGLLCNLPASMMDADAIAKFNEMRSQLLEHPLATVHTESQILDHDGFAGQFVTTIRTPGSEIAIEHGTAILATEGQEVATSSYSLGDRVGTQGQLTQKLFGGADALTKDAKRYVMIQCVDSRCDERLYCSRFCCDTALRNALALLDREPTAQITVLYQEMMTYGLLEDKFLEARDRGIRFLRYPQGQMPQVAETDDGVSITYRDTVLRRDVSIRADRVVLSTGMDPDPVNSELGGLFKIPLDEDGFFHEAHVKLRPVDFASKGLFVCGLGHAPHSVTELITEAYAAAGRAATLLSSPYLEAGGVVSTVEKDKCVACLTCVRECPFSAAHLDVDNLATVDPAKCQGCGICAAECPVKAIQLQQFEDIQEISMLSALDHMQRPSLTAKKMVR